uniref:Uncharacterized protein n=1 Tax=Romanomermis culicivorax TaxID=13658 RepID=A0A915HPQ4_ROMCU
MILKTQETINFGGGPTIKGDEFPPVVVGGDNSSATILGSSSAEISAFCGLDIKAIFGSTCVAILLQGAEDHYSKRLDCKQFRYILRFYDNDLGHENLENINFYKVHRKVAQPENFMLEEIEILILSEKRECDENEIFFKEFFVDVRFVVQMVRTCINSHRKFLTKLLQVGKTCGG